MASAQNIIGAQVRRLRNQRDLTQEQLSAKIQLLGLEMSRATLSKIEAGLRCVVDSELPIIAEALKVGIADLFPIRSGRRRGLGTSNNR
jgi:transcriptional regulator with XRE-family HTH domain